jgi:hypothetical protein
MAELAAQAPRHPAGEASLIRFSVRLPAIAPLMIAGLFVRLALALLPGFGVDIGTFTSWSNDLAVNNPWNFYRQDYFTDYAPGYMYVLWVIGEINQQAHFDSDQMEYVLKLPSIAADLGSAYLLYVVLAAQRQRVRLGAVAAYLFFPPSLLIGAVWGQVDSILSFFLLLSVYYIGTNHPVRGAVAYTVGFLVKPQAIAALPFLAFWILRDNIKLNPKPGEEMIPRQVIMCIVIPLGVLLVLITPFFKLEPWRLLDVLYEATNVSNYRVNSFWSYNFWNSGGLFHWGFRCDLASACPKDPNAQDATSFLGVATRYWGIAMFGSAIAAILWTLRNARGMGFLALGTALSMLAFYMFLTRMHERYVFAAFLPFLLACALIHSRALWAVFIAASTVHFLNLYHVYTYYYPNELKWDQGYRWLADGDALGSVLNPIDNDVETVQIMSVAFVVCFLVTLGLASVLAQRKPDPDARL